MRAFVADEQGQATTEYVMLLAILAGLILTIGVAFGKKIKQLLNYAVGNRLQGQFFNGRAAHTFRFRLSR